MTEKETIKYIDEIFKEIEDFDFFSVNNILYDIIEPKSEEEKVIFFEIVEAVKLFGRNNNLFVARNKDGWCKLTEKGKLLKLSNKNFIKFSNLENRTDWYNKPIIGYLIAFFALLFNVYQWNDSRILNKENRELISKQKADKDSISTLNEKLQSYKKVDSLPIIN